MSVLLNSYTPPRSIYNKTVLPNGIRVVTEEIPYVRSASLGIWIDVGSRDENPNNNGISHFLEHMVFKGTRRYNTRQIAESLESVGGYLNAFTSKEHTCFYARTLDEHLPKAVGVLSDLVQHPLINVNEMEKEKFVVLEELKNLEDDPDDLIHDYFDKTVFQKHPLGFSVIGKAENIKNFKKGELFDYTASHYLTNRMVVAAAGNIKHDAVLNLIEKYIQKNNIHKRLRGRLKPPKQLNPKIRMYEKHINQAHICMGTIGYSIKSRHRYSALLLNTLLGEGMSSRLFQNIREKYGFAYNIFSFLNLLSDTGNFGIYVGTDKNNIDNSIDLVHKELDKIKLNSVKKSEMNRTKAKLKGSLMLSLESMSSRMMRLGSGEIYLKEYLPLNEVIREIDEVRTEDLITIADKLFNYDNFSTVIFKPIPENKTL